MKSREHVTTNGRAVFFAAMWEDLRNAATSHGWALALHGSLSNDMDIMAMPWDEHASPVDVMINQICICFTEAGQIEKGIKISKDKPNNRTVYTLSIWADFYLDINVIEPATPPTYQEGIVQTPFCVTEVPYEDKGEESTSHVEGETLEAEEILISNINHKHLSSFNGIDIIEVRPELVIKAMTEFASLKVQQETQKLRDDLAEMTERYIVVTSHPTRAELSKLKG